jgi:hypothetical protein
MMSEVSDFIDKILNKDYNQANDIFSDLMSSRVNDLLDQEKVSVASNMFNDIETQTETDEDAEDIDIDDEDLGLEDE